MKAISLFSGCGGDTLGMINAGIDVIGYCEIEKIFCESHDANFKNCKLIENDISKIKQFDQMVDIIFSGIACQSFSTAGKKDPNDPRGQLYKYVVKAVTEIKPELLIIENVKGLLTRKNEKLVLFFDIITSAFKDLGYFMDYRLYKASDFGVPQDRERLIILFSKNNLKLPESPKIPKVGLQHIIKFSMENAIQVPEIVMKGIPSECILTDLENEETENNPHPYLRKRLIETNVHYNGKFVGEYGFSFGKRISPVHCEIIDIRKPSKTIICTYDHAPRLFVPLKNKNGYFLRTLNINELKEIQGFPKDFVLCGNKSKQIIQIGNAVPPPMIKFIFEKII